MNESAQYGLYNPGVSPTVEDRIVRSIVGLHAEVCVLRDDIAFLRNLITNTKCCQKPRPHKRKPTDG